MFEVLIRRQKAVGKKNIGLPIAHYRLRTLRTGLEKIANRPIPLNLIPASPSGPKHGNGACQGRKRKLSVITGTKLFIEI